MTLTIESAGTWTDSDCPDVYYTAGYGVPTAATEPGDWFMARDGDRILLPYIRRAVAPGSYDVVSPYGYAGIHVAPDCTPEAVRQFWTELRAAWRDSGIVSAFLRFSPLDPSCVRVASTLDGLDLTRRQDTVYVRTAGGVDDVWQGLRKEIRKAVRKATRAGLTARIRPATPADVAAGTPFRTLYEWTMRRVDATERYFFPDGYYTGLVDGLGKQLLLADVCRPDGKTVASGLVLVHGERVHYHLTGSDPEAAADRANNLLVWTILEWAADSGAALVHLGGGLRPGDGLEQFKRSFRGELGEFWTGAAVVDEPRYRHLVAEHAAATGRTPADIARSGWFPGYRAP